MTTLPIAPGDVLDGKYRILSAVGSGGMAVVLAARHLQLGHDVAIKVLHVGASEERVTRFVREARALVQIRSPHVVQVYDVGTLPSGAPFIVMELLAGEDLGQLVRRSGGLPIADAVDYVRQTCMALSEVHRLGVVHRDIKPANIFLAQTGQPRPTAKVLDFGISKITAPDGEALTGTSDVMGSPRYMSPEQLRSSRDVDARTDIWSLGATLYRLLTGASAFTDTSNAELVVSILQEAPTDIRTIRPEVPAQLNAIVLRCLSKDPAARFQSADELSAALAAFLDGSITAGITAGSDGLTPQSNAAAGGPPPPASRPSRRNAWLLAAAGSVLVLAGGVLAFSLRSDPTSAGQSSESRAKAAKASKDLEPRFEKQSRGRAAQDSAPSGFSQLAKMTSIMRAKLGNPKVLQIVYQRRYLEVVAKGIQGREGFYTYVLYKWHDWKEPRAYRSSYDELEMFNLADAELDR